MQGELNVEEVETLELLGMPRVVEIPMDDIEMSLEGAEFVIPDTEDSQEMSLEGAEFVIQENGETQGDDPPEVPNQSTKLLEDVLTQKVQKNRQIALEERDTTQIQRKEIELGFRVTDDPIRRYIKRYYALCFLIFFQVWLHQV